MPSSFKMLTWRIHNVDCLISSHANLVILSHYCCGIWVDYWVYRCCGSVTWKQTTSSSQRSWLCSVAMYSYCGLQGLPTFFFFFSCISCAINNAKHLHIMQVSFLLFKCGMWYLINMKQKTWWLFNSIMTVFINHVFFFYVQDLWIYLQGFISYPPLHISVQILNNILWFNIII